MSATTRPHATTPAGPTAPDIPARTTSGGATTIPAADVDALAAGLRGGVVRPGEAGYDTARRVWNGMIDRHPALVVACAGTADVQAAVRFAAGRDLLVSVRGGGHNAAGTAVADGAVVIDLAPMRAVWVDPATRTARAQGGATIGDLDRETQLFGLAVPQGVVSETGIAGLTLGGGYGWLRRRHGLACDNLLAAEVVLADGSVVTADEERHPDLLWALRGGGVGVGVVTSFELRAHPVGPEVVLAVVFHRGEAEAVRAFRDWCDTAPDDLSALAMLWHAPAIDEIPVEHHGAPVLVTLAVHPGPVEEAEAALAPLRRLGRPIADLTSTLPWVEAQRSFDADYPKWEKRYYWTSTYVRELGDGLIDELVERNRQAPSPESSLDVWHLGGAVARVPADATGFGDRGAPFLLGVEANWEHGADDGANVAWAREALRAAAPWSTGIGYRNFPGFHEDPEHRQVHDRRRARVHRRYDPEGFFTRRP